MMSMLRSLKGSWYLGKGSKAFRNGRYEQALNYFLSSLEYAVNAENCGEVAVRKEAIAETYFKLGSCDKARLFADESMEIYKNLFSKDNSEIFKESINRINRLLDEIRYKENEYK